MYDALDDFFHIINRLGNQWKVLRRDKEQIRWGDANHVYDSLFKKGESKDKDGDGTSSLLS